MGLFNHRVSLQITYALFYLTFGVLSITAPISAASTNIASTNIAYAETLNVDGNDINCNDLTDNPNCITHGDSQQELSGDGSVGDSNARTTLMPVPVVSGVVFRDYNANGIQDIHELGISNITVTGYDDVGTIETVTTSDDGTYQLFSLTASVGRIEFTDVPSYLFAGSQGPDSGTTIQFIDLSSGSVSNVDLALQNPAHYCQSAPTVGVACYAHGDPTLGGVTAMTDVFVTFPYTRTGERELGGTLNPGYLFPNPLATGIDIGSTWGVAYQRSTGTLFASAHLKRHAGFASLGTGGIYEIPVSGTNTPFIDLQSLGIDTGIDPHTGLPNDGISNQDAGAFDWVGKRSLGGMDISEDERTLWVMNLHRRTLEEIFIDLPARPPITTDVISHDVHFAFQNTLGLNCSNGEFRPWAVKVHDGKVYVGAVCSAELGGNTNDLHAYILAHDPEGPDGNFSLLYDFQLDYPKGCTANGNQCGWEPWVTNFAEYFVYTAGQNKVMHPQPILSSIEFDIDGSLILGLMDRTGHQVSHDQLDTGGGPTNYRIATGGDILRVCYKNGAFYMDGEPDCPNNATNGEGPNGGEYYMHDNYNGTPLSRNELALGGLALLYGSGEIMTTSAAPRTAPATTSLWHSAGVFRFDNKTGDAGTPPTGYALYDNDIDPIARASDLGDLTLLCDPAPIEIGNRVWHDVNGDGNQDPGEPPIGGVTVNLYDPIGTLLASALTDGNGEYYFSSGNGPSIPSDVYNVAGLTYNTAGYTLALDNVADYSSGPLIDFFLTIPDVNSGPNREERDSDALYLSGFPTIVFDTRGAGDNDHTYDIGFVPEIHIGDFVWDDLNQNGMQDVGEPGVAGIVATLFYNSNLSTGLTTTTDISGAYLFTGLTPENYYVQFDLSTLPVGYGVTARNVATDTLDSDVSPGNGRTDPTGFLAPGAQDLSLDMGIFMLGNALIGDLVWDDLNQDGIQDAGEPGIAGVIASLYMSPTTFLASTTTDISGTYIFTGLAAGDYYVVFDPSTLPPSYIFSPDSQGGNNQTDSDVMMPGTGQTHVITLAPSEMRWALDAGAYQALGTIGDTIWEDDNGNGLLDLGETGIPSVMVTLVYPTGMSISVSTNINGQYAFANLPSGLYTVTVDTASLPIGYQPTYDLDMTLDHQASAVLLNPGQNRVDVNFGYLPAAAVGGKVWEDLNEDGIQDAGEVSFSGVTVTLFDDLGTQIGSSVTTDPIGNYLFQSLAPGDYQILFSDLPADYEFSFQDQGGDDTLDSDANPADGRTVLITLAAGVNDQTWDAGIFMPVAAIGDLVWHDLNINGIQDAGEPGVAGVTVRLLDNLGTLLSTLTTDVNGYFNFTGLTPGDYELEFVNLPSGYLFSPRHLGGDTELDSNADISMGNTGAFTLNPSTDDLSRDAGIYLPSASFGGQVWEDLNENGLQNVGEPGHQGITVTLFSGIGTQIGAPIVTGPNGDYLFANLVPGDYYAAFTNLPTDYVYSPRDQGGDDTIDSDANFTTGRTAVTTLDPGESEQNWDAGIYLPLVPLDARVWHDLNANGVQDVGEPGIPGVSVTLFNVPFGQVGLPVTTDANGNYGFSGLPPGTYYLAFSNLPVGYQFSPQDMGGSDALDSDADPATGQTAQLSLPTGSGNTDVDAGLYHAISVGGQVWDDQNGDGLQSGEGGISGIGVELFHSDDVSTGLLATTDASGHYTFTNLVPGGYYVQFDLGTLSLGYVVTGQDIGTSDAQDSDADPITGQTNDSGFLPSSSQFLTLDMGIKFVPSQLEGMVWNDVDRNGIRAPSETAISGALVTLFDGAGTQIGLPFTTGIDGRYIFTDLVPSTYHLSFGNLPTGYLFGLQDQGGDDAVDSDVDPANSRTANLTLTLGENRQNVDAGVHSILVSLGNLVWEDLNQDGIQNLGEPGVSGVLVTLFDGSGAQVGSPQTTDGAGLYEFTGLLPGGYALAFSNLPPNYIFTPQDQGGDDTLDSDASDVGPTMGQTGIISLTAGSYLWDAGIYQPLSSLGNRVWDDLNGNGLQEGGEPGVPGVTVTLLDGLGAAIGMSVTTDANGFYNFSGLLPGSYALAFADLPPGYTFSPPDQGGDDALDSDVVLATGRTAAITVGVNGDSPDWDAGIHRPPTAIGGFVWKDLNQDGLQDVSEPGVGGIIVSLLDMTDTLVEPPITTDASGHYSFTALLPGNYYIAFSGMPTGYQFGPQDIGGDDTLDSEADITTGKTISIPLGIGQNMLNWDAALYRPPASVSGRVWDDINGDSLQSPNELGVPGVTVSLLNSSAGVITTTQTVSGTGAYTFTNLAPGDYYVAFSDLPTTYQYTLPNQGSDDALDSDVEPSDGLIGSFTLTAGQHLFNQDAGITLPPSSLGGRVWNDINGNGLQDADEQGMAGVTVALFNEHVILMAAPVITDGDGHYQFDNLPADNYYLVYSKLPTGFYFSQKNQGGDDALDSDPNPGGGLAGIIPLGAGQNYLTWDAGIYRRSSSLGGKVWGDLNVNGLQEADEPAISGVTVSLFDQNVLLKKPPITTGEDGHYEFSNIAPGYYYLVFSNLPSGYRFGPANQGTDDELDSDVASSGGLVGLILVTAGQNSLSWDAGIYQPFSSLGGRVWHDTNGNGIQNPNEPGAANITVALFDQNIVLMDAPIRTDESGRYQFDSLPAGKYFLLFFDLPSGYLFSPSNRGRNERQDSDVGPSGGINQILSLRPGERNLALDAGIYQTKRPFLGGQVWKDLNQNGHKDANEPGIPGVEVMLLDRNNQPVDISVITDINGLYLFTDIPPGTYSLSFSNLPDDHEFVAYKPNNNGSGGGDSSNDNSQDDAWVNDPPINDPSFSSESFNNDVNPETGRTGLITLELGKINVDAGVYVPSPAETSSDVDDTAEEEEAVESDTVESDTAPDDELVVEEEQGDPVQSNPIQTDPEVDNNEQNTPTENDELNDEDDAYPTMPEQPEKIYLPVVMR